LGKEGFTITRGHKVKLYRTYALSVDVEGVLYVYIGSTYDMQTRYRLHMNSLQRNKHANKTLQQIFNDGYKYLRLEILETVEDRNSRYSSEKEYIEHFKRLDGVIVCNVYNPPLKMLIAKEVVAIKRLLNKGEAKKVIYKKYGISPKQLYDIKTCNRYKHILKNLKGGES
jgi:hypothetical protein